MRTVLIGDVAVPACDHCDQPRFHDGACANDTVVVPSETTPQPRRQANRRSTVPESRKSAERLTMGHSSSSKQPANNSKHPRCLVCDFRTPRPLCAKCELRYFTMGNPLPASDPEWQNRAACRNADPQRFFRGDAPPHCDACPVRLECFREAIDLAENRGWRAGRRSKDIQNFRRYWRQAS